MPANLTGQISLYPERLEDALEIVRATIADCEKEGIAARTIIAAVMTELVPRFVETYGPAATASVFSDLAKHISNDANDESRITRRGTTH